MARSTVLFWDLLFVFIFAVVPGWLVLTAWRRYHALNFTRSRDLFLTRWVLAFLSLALGVLLVLVTLATFEERLGATKTVNEFMPAPWKVGMVNFLLCVSCLMVVLRVSRETKEIVRLRSSAVTLSIYLMILSLLIMGAAH